MLWRVTSRKKEQESPRVGVLSRISWLFARGSVHLSVKLCSSGQRAVAKPRARGKIQVWRYLKLSLAALCYVFSGQPGFLAEGATGGAFPWNRATFTVSLTYQIYIQIIYIYYMYLYMICIWYVYDMYMICILYIIYYIFIQCYRFWLFNSKNSPNQSSSNSFLQLRDSVSIAVLLMLSMQRYCPLYYCVYDLHIFIFIYLIRSQHFHQADVSGAVQREQNLSMMLAKVHPSMLLGSSTTEH